MYKTGVNVLTPLTIVAMIVTCSLSLADSSQVEIIELSARQKQALLDAPPRYIASRGHPVVDNAIQNGIADSIRVERLGDSTLEAGADPAGPSNISTHQGWVFYKPVRLSTTREYHPAVLCISQDIDMTWIACQDESWTMVQTPSTTGVIRLDGSLSDELIEEALQFVDGIELVSKRDNSPITAESIHHIVGSMHPGDSQQQGDNDNSVRLFARTGVDGDWDAIDLVRNTAADGASVFELEEFRSGQ